MAQKTFSDRTLFNTYICNTDDCMHALMNFYPTDAAGNMDYSPDKKQQQAAWKCWGLTEAESKQWSLFRQRNNELDAKFIVSAEGAERNSLQELLDKNQADFLAYKLIPK